MGLYETSHKSRFRKEKVLPGPIGLPRKAKYYFKKVKMTDKNLHRSGLLSAYALALAEENAAGNLIVIAPTCDSCGILPAVLYYLKEVLDLSTQDILRALATAGLVGNLVKHNASISGAKVVCQGDVETASSMAAAAVQLMGASVKQIEYAAEMGLEHNLGLICDPVFGMVQIPCIGRKVFAAKRALSCAEYAWFSDGSHRITFDDDVVEVMNKTGTDLNENYRETSLGGLARYICDRLTKERS